MSYEPSEQRDDKGRWSRAASASANAVKMSRTARSEKEHVEAAKAHQRAAEEHQKAAAEHLEAAGDAGRVQRAIDSQVRTGQREQAIADRSEAVLSRAIGVPRTRNNSAFDLRNDDVGVEVKTLVNGKNEKITMSKAALGRKLAEQRGDGLRGYTVVVDRRSGGLKGAARYFVKEGFGSFRLGSMQQTTLAKLKEMM